MSVAATLSPAADVRADFPGMVTGEMGELQAADDVADGEHPLVGGAQAGIDLDALVRIGDAGFFQVQPLDVGAPPGGDEDAGAFDGPLGAAVFLAFGNWQGSSPALTAAPNVFKRWPTQAAAVSGSRRTVLCSVPNWSSASPKESGSRQRTAEPK